MSVEAFRALVALVEQHFEVKTQRDVGGVLGLHQPQVANWLKNPGASQRTWERLYRKLVEQAAKELVWPLVEFEEVAPVRKGGSWQIDADAAIRSKLKTKLGGQVGLYMYYDSAGRILYVGQAKTNLWAEVVQRLKASVNRDICLPKKTKNAAMGQFARRVSAYGVGVPSAIPNLEALLIRAFANDHGNTNSANFRFRQP